ncbi:hypothetical protein OUZ56_012229 [Daphnia magna]|uniref:Uncharacterized protein n=1 Tax=Daphnia magna TaxID=35525 RepID=A0ABQ9Z2G2_9CRUS|nr:hypothetical protein OUZ56_012229 [Daphnia magna]
MMVKTIRVHRRYCRCVRRSAAEIGVYTGSAPFDALVHADSGSMNFSALSNGYRSEVMIFARSHQFPDSPQVPGSSIPMASNPMGFFSISIFFGHE